MGDLVVYHNDFNKLKIPNFTAQEQNMLMGILLKVKNSTDENIIKLTPQELLNYSTENLTNKALGDMLYILRQKFFKADFTILIKHETENLIGKETINLFEKFTLWYPSDDKNFDNLKSVELKVNPQFKYLVQELTAHFTEFELLEFMMIGSKYAKTLYRLLKQYRSTGYLKMEWQEFCNILDIPQSYKMSHIDQKILNPAIAELSAEPNLFNEKQVIFKNLTYEKIKDKSGRGRGGKVVGIEFKFDKTSKSETEKIQTEKPKKIAVTETIYFETEQEKRDYLANRKRNG